MPTVIELTDALKAAEKDLSELQSDLPKLEALLAKHEAMVSAATTAACKDPDDADAVDLLSEARRRCEAVSSMLEQHRADISETETRVVELRGQLQAESNRRAKLEARKAHRGA